MKILTYFMFLVFTTSCAQKTSTPKKFMNVNNVPREIYDNDLVHLADIVKVHYDSINNVVNPQYKTNLLKIKIDTIFYGNDNKIVFLVLLEEENKYAEKGIQYAGECYIGYKKNKVENLYKLKNSSTSANSLLEVSGMIRKIYLREMNYMKEQYNINDIRFWNSYVWKEAEEMRAKRKHFEEMKKNHPENVYY